MWPVFPDYLSVSYDYDLRESVRRKNRNRCGEEIDACVILLRLCDKLFPKRIGNWKSEIGLPNCIYSDLGCVLEYTGHFASRNIVVEIWEDVFKVSFADFWSQLIFHNYKI